MSQGDEDDDILEDVLDEARDDVVEHFDGEFPIEIRGLRTTMAVVQAIFMVIVLDAFFAVFFSEVGWE